MSVRVPLDNVKGRMFICIFLCDMCMCGNPPFMFHQVITNQCQLVVMTVCTLLYHNVCVCTCVCVCVCVSVSVSECVCVCVCAHAHVCTCVHTCMCACMHVCMCLPAACVQRTVCISICMYMSPIHRKE